MGFTHLKEACRDLAKHFKPSYNLELSPAWPFIGSPVCLFSRQIRYYSNTETIRSPVCLFSRQIRYYSNTETIRSPVCLFSRQIRYYSNTETIRSPVCLFSRQSRYYSNTETIRSPVCLFSRQIRYYSNTETIRSPVCLFSRQIRYYSNTEALGYILRIRWEWLTLMALYLAGSWKDVQPVNSHMYSCGHNLVKALKKCKWSW